MPTYNKGDFTQQGIDGYVTGSLQLNNKRIVDVKVSSDDESETISKMCFKVRDELNDLEYHVCGENIGTGESEIGAGGENIIPKKIKFNITNTGSNDDVYFYTILENILDLNEEVISGIAIIIDGINYSSDSIPAIPLDSTQTLYLIPQNQDFPEEGLILELFTSFSTPSATFTVNNFSITNAEETTVTDPALYSVYYKITDYSKLTEITADITFTTIPL